MSSLNELCHLLQWASEFPRQLVRGGLGCQVPRFSEMVNHMSLLRELYAPLADSSPGVMGLGNCESLFNHLEKEQTIAEEYAARDFLQIQRPLRNGELGSAYWLPGLENPADGVGRS